jgi:prephenate dehydratase
MKALYNFSYWTNSCGAAVFDAVEKGRTTYGLVPYENSTFGSVVETLDRLMLTETKVRAETYLTVSLIDNIAMRLMP